MRGELPESAVIIDDGDEFFDEEKALSQLLADGVLFANSRKYLEIKWVQKPGVEVPKDGVPMGKLGEFYDFVDGPPQPETIVLFVNCNDVFAWACADAEPIMLSELRALYDRWRANRSWGAIQWCCLKRGVRPQAPVLKDMKAAGMWDEALEALPVREARR